MDGRFGGAQSGAPVEENPGTGVLRRSFPKIGEDFEEFSEIHVGVGVLRCCVDEGIEDGAACFGAACGLGFGYILAFIDCGEELGEVLIPNLADVGGERIYFCGVDDAGEVPSPHMASFEEVGVELLTTNVEAACEMPEGHAACVGTGGTKEFTESKEFHVNKAEAFLSVNKGLNFKFYSLRPGHFGLGVDEFVLPICGEEAADAFNEFGEAEGFGEVVVGALGEAVLDFFLGVHRGEEEDGECAGLCVGAYSSAELEAGHAGEHDVEYEEVD